MILCLAMEVGDLADISAHRGKSFNLETSTMIHHAYATYPTHYLLLRYQLNASCCVSAGNGVGTSAKPGLATGCLKYTAEQIL